MSIAKDLREVRSSSLSDTATDTATDTAGLGGQLLRLRRQEAAVQGLAARPGQRDGQRRADGE